MLANILIVDKCVTTLIPGKLYAVKQGAAPPSILKTDVSHRFCFVLDVPRFVELLCAAA